MALRPLLCPLVAFVGTTVLIADLPLSSAADSTPRRPKTESKRAAAASPKEFSTDRFVRLFRTSREEAKLAAVCDAGRSQLENADLPDALWQVIQPARDGKAITPAMLAAVRLYAELPGEGHSERQFALLEAGDARIVLAAADGLANRQAPDALAPIGALRRHPDYARRYAFRHSVLSSMARYTEPAAVEWLIETLAVSDGQLKYETARHLARLTGENFGGKGDEWRTWWNGHQAEFIAARPTPAAARFEPPVSANMPWDEPVPTFFNVPIYARRVVFVIDRSKSMESSVDNVTRLDDAQRELEQAVRGLSEKSQFNLVAYDTMVRLWKEQLVPATVQNKSESLRFVYSLFPDSKTACYDALAGALALDPNLELIVFLSDGEPNAGRIIDPQRIVQEISARNATGRVRIDVLGLDAQGPSEAFLRTLAESNFGTYRPIR